jgi:hypothetical protein
MFQRSQVDSAVVKLSHRGFEVSMAFLAAGFYAARHITDLRGYFGNIQSHKKLREL